MRRPAPLPPKHRRGRNDPDTPPVDSVFSLGASLSRANKLPEEDAIQSHEVKTEPPPHTYECQVCFDPIHRSKAHICRSCQGSFCLSCTRWYIELKVLDGEVTRQKLVCPAADCTSPLLRSLIQQFVSPDIFDKYVEFVKNQKSGIRFCPRAGCCSIIEEPLFSKHRRVLCSKCMQTSCMRCGDVFHKVPVCRRVEKRFSKWRKRHNVRACPSCKADIEKNAGCRHMKCAHCSHEFCWLCLRSWHGHNDQLCRPLGFVQYNCHKYGFWAPVCVVAKTTAYGVAAAVVVAGGLVGAVTVLAAATVVVPVQFAYDRIFVG